MSYGKFIDELGMLISEYDKEYPGNDHDLDFYQGLLRDKWIKEGRITELISYIHENWDCGNPDDFIPPLEKFLLSQKHSKSFIRLWRGIIKIRLKDLWYYLRESKKNGDQYPIFKEHLKKQQKVTLKGISKFEAGLNELNDSHELQYVKLTKITVTALEQPKRSKAKEKRGITESVFWELIDEAIESDRNDIDYETYLIARLTDFGPSQIKNFERIFRELDSKLYTWEHWALAYIVRRGCGDDAFDYFRAWVIAQGKDKYYSVFNMKIDERKNIFQSDPQFEAFIYIAESAYEEVSDSILKVKTTKKKLTGKEWQEDVLPSLYPELCKIFDYKYRELL